MAQASLGSPAMQALKVDLLVRGQLVRSFTFAASTITVGRDPRSRLYIDNPSVSREHARFILTAGGCILEDGGSANGTFVNGEPIARRAVLESDQIQIGKFTLRARVVDNGTHDNPERTLELSTDELARVMSARTPVRGIATLPPPAPASHAQLIVATVLASSIGAVVGALAMWLGTTSH